MVIHVTDGNIAEFLQSEKTVVLDFSAAWCGPCKILSPILDEIAVENAGDFVIGKIDVDENPLTTEKYGIMSMPTLMVFKNGEVVDTTVGLRPKADLLHYLSAFKASAV